MKAGLSFAGIGLLLIAIPLSASGDEDNMTAVLDQLLREDCAAATLDELESLRGSNEALNEFDHSEEMRLQLPN